VKVAEHLIRDHVLLKANDPYNRTRLEASRRRLLDLELFSDVAISTRRGSSPTSVEVTVEVTE
jgi:outer membrane protein assembly factor BamA